MKRFIYRIQIIAWSFVALNLHAQQNKPGNLTLPSGSAPNEISYPLDFNQSPNASPTRYNYTREFYPISPMTSVPAFDNSKTAPVLVNTTYLDGWQRPAINVLRTGSNHDIVTPFANRSSDTTVEYLPYSDTFHSKFHNEVFTRQKNYYDLYYPAESHNAYIKTVASNPGKVPTTKTFAPGKALAGYDRGNTETVDINIGNEVLRLYYDAGEHSICKEGNPYAAYQLDVIKSKGQHGQEEWSYIDKDGKLICEKQHVGGSVGNNGWLTNYYLYDELDRVTYMVPPKACEWFNSNTCLHDTLINKLCFKYEYDKEGQLLSKKVPGRNAADEAVYNGDKQLVISRTPNLAYQNKWYFTIYDSRNRALITGIYTGSASLSYWRNLMDGSGSPTTYYRGGVAVPDTQTLEYWLRNELQPEHYPDSLYGCEIYTYNYYDSYNQPVPSLTSYSTAHSGDFLTGGTAETPTPYYYAIEKPVASKVKIIDTAGIANNFTNSWITSVFYYDEKGRIIQTQTLNPWGHWDVHDIQYNFISQPVINVQEYTVWSGANKPNTKIVTQYQYSAATARLQQVLQRTDANTNWTTVSSYTYDDLGRVNHKWVGDNIVQQQAYSYNIRGQLKGINAANMQDVTLDPSISYASELCYETGFDTARYDGGLSGYKWRSASTEPRAYGYLYDTAGRMVYADYRDSSRKSGTTNWNKLNRDFTVSNLTYDANGNIATMNQKGYDNSHGITDVDILTYTYESNSNKLLSVTDAGYTSPENDFENGSNSGDDYTYDGNGNLISDANKSITTISYDYIDKMIGVDKTGEKLRNIYDASGSLLHNYIESSADTFTYRYWGSLVFKDDTLQYFMQPEGRCRWVADSNFLKYDYFIRDHQDNVRTVVTEDYTEGPELHAGFEYVRANIESTIFDHLNEIRDWSPAGAPDNEMAGWLNGCDSPKRIGAAVLLHVMAGDQFNIKGYGYYESNDTTAMNTYPPAEDMLSGITGALTGAGAVTGGGEGGSAITGTTIGNLLTSGNYDIYNTIKNGITDPNYPRTYLNYLVFNEDMTIQAEECRAVQLKGPANTWNLMEFGEDMTISANGYVLAYFSNESCIDAAIDEIHAITIKGRLLEEQHYYPHGLVVEGGTQNGAIPNKFLFESNHLETGLNLFLSDFNARNYDQQIGRFTSVDPLADDGQEQWNPYHFVGNDPANFTDPFGLNRRKKKQLECPKVTDDGGGSGSASGSGGSGGGSINLGSVPGDYPSAPYSGGGESFQSGPGGGGSGSVGSATNGISGCQNPDGTINQAMAMSFIIGAGYNPWGVDKVWTGDCIKIYWNRMKYAAYNAPRYGNNGVVSNNTANRQSSSGYNVFSNSSNHSESSGIAIPIFEVPGAFYAPSIGVTAAGIASGVGTVIAVLLPSNWQRPKQYWDPGMMELTRRMIQEFASEHTKGARPSTKGKHEKGQTRKDLDRRGGKGMKKPPQNRPPGHKGPWPPKTDWKKWK